MQFLTTAQIREKWINFFVKRKHLFITPKSLIPQNDPSLLWINSGIATLKDYFSGKLTPECPRIVNSQPSIRTNDIENVGITSRHHTIFEMLGFFSIGDYFKERAIELGFELLIKEFEVPIQKLYITVFKNDEVAYKKWIELGILKNHIAKCDKERNFWDIGQGPCGPCTEIFFDRGEKYDVEKIGEKLFFEDLENDRYIEIGNIVFSEYNNDGNNNYSELAQKNIDTGWGLERWACIFQDVPTNFDTDCFSNIIHEIEKTCDKTYDSQNFFKKDLNQEEINKCFRIITDHIKANVFAINDGATLSNNGRGSILRRLLRRSMVCARKLGCSMNFIQITVNAIINEYKNFFQMIEDSKIQIIEILENERKTFESALERGMRMFEKEIEGKSFIQSDIIFKLVDTYGFPFEIIKELCEQNNISFDTEKYYEFVAQHQKISRGDFENKGMNIQSKDLIKFEEPSVFLYDTYELNDVNIIAIFDTNFNKIEKAQNQCWLVFDKTVFYATSGGQEHDRGVIQIGEIKYEVLDVIKTSIGQHLHLINLDGNTITNRLKAILKIDAVFRKNVTRNHTTEHILEHVLNKNIDSSIKQEGAYKTDSYFTFDFKLNRRLSEQEIELVQEKVNEIINEEHEVCTAVKKHEEAINNETVGHFTNVYKKIKDGLRVVSIKGVNDEICGGTHVNNTKDIQKFIISEYFAKGTGFWRIVGITSNDSISKYIDSKIEEYQKLINEIKEQIAKYKIKNEEIEQLLQTMNFHSSVKNLIELKKHYLNLNIIFIEYLKLALKSENEENIKNIKETEKLYSSFNNMCYFTVYDKNQKNIISALNELQNELSNPIIICINVTSDKIQYFISCKKDSIFTAKQIIEKINQVSQGAGGGNTFFAQGGSIKKESLNVLLEEIGEF